MFDYEGILAPALYQFSLFMQNKILPLFLEGGFYFATSDYPFF